MSGLGRRRAAAWYFVAAVLVARCAWSAWDIATPGVHYDELLFVNAATHRLPGPFIDEQFHGVPITLMQYIGALKAWLYTPWFALVDPSPASIRLPMVVATSAGLAILFAAARRVAGQSTALLAFVLLSTDATLFWLTRDDVGPNALGFVLKAVALYGVARLVAGEDERRTRWAVLVVAAVALGVFNKLNFIWNLNAMVVIAVVAAARHRDWLRENRAAAVVLVGGTAAVYAGFVGWALATNLEASQTTWSLSGVLTDHVSSLAHGTVAVLSGDAFRQMVLGATAAGTPPVGLLAAGLLLGLAVVGSVFAVRPATRNRPVAAVGIAGLLIVPQVLVTQQATSPWHYLEISPFVSIAAAYGVTASVRQIGLSVRAATTVTAAVATLVAAYGVGQGLRIHDAIARGPVRAIWSDEIYRLSQVLDATTGEVVLADWGMGNQLAALDNAHARRYHDQAFALRHAAPGSAPAAAFAARVAALPGAPLVVVHGERAEVFAGTRAATLDALHGHLEHVATVGTGTGAVLFEVYRYRR